MVATGFTNTFNSGEISEDAWDRTDLQPVAKGCELAQNYVVRIAGPLGKRRGFWRLGDTFDSHSATVLVPFRRSIDDALMLELSDVTCRVWNNNGAPLIDPGTGLQVTFASPYSAADLNGLRYKQVGDVIYLRNAAGLLPLTLERLSNTSWAFTAETFPDGPWRPENLDRAFTLTVTGADEADTNPATGAGSILVGQAVDLVASAALFDPLMVGGRFRVRQNDGAPSVQSWKAGYRPTAGTYVLSVGRVYRCSAQGGHDETVTTPPVHEFGSASDGGNTYDYRHNGAGIIEITAVADATHASGMVMATVPFRSGNATTFWAEAAYSPYRGWPRMWPGLREERLVEGATASNLDFIDLSETAAFSPSTESFKPGLGTGQVLATDAVRRRVGTDGSELLWSAEATYLIVGSGSAEYLVAGSVLDEAISPSAIVLKTLSEYGSADVLPVRAHRGLIHVTRGGQSLRELIVSTDQTATSDDLTVLAQHVATRGFAQLAWVPQPDENLWLRLTDTVPGDGGLAVMTYHKEQQVRGFASVRLPGGFVCENIAVLPGPGRLETLWMVVSRVKGGVTQRCLWLQSAVTDKLFMDGAALYAGAPTLVVADLDHYEGETVRILADYVQVPDQVVVGGRITLEVAATVVLVGQGYLARFKSLKLDKQLGGELNMRQRVTDCTVSMKTAKARCGLDGGPLETISPRTAADVPGMVARRVIRDVSLAGDSDRDPRIVIEDDTALDSVIYSLKPRVAVGG
jgi:hypothetical protein